MSATSSARAIAAATTAEISPLLQGRHPQGAQAQGDFL